MKKRIIIIFFATLLLFCACQPTPEAEIVINKGDNVLEQKLYATAKPVEDSVTLIENTSAASNDEAKSEPTVPNTGIANEPTAKPVKQQVFPDRWDEDGIQLREHVTLSIHTDVITRADGQYPAYRTRVEPFTEEDVARIADILLSRPVARELIEAKTKKELEAELQQYLDEVADWEEWVANGKQGDRDDTGFDPEEVKATTDWYMKEIQNAPDTLDTVPVSDYSGYRIGQRVNYQLENGEKATIFSIVSNSWNSLQISNRCKRNGYVYYESAYLQDKDDPSYGDKLWMETTMSREDAEAILRREMERLGLMDFEIRFAERATLRDVADNRDAGVSGGWGFELQRSFGYPLIDSTYMASSHLEFGVGDGMYVNEPIRDETITVFVDENGVEYFLYSGRKTVLQQINPNVELLPFADVQKIVKNTLAVSCPTWACTDESGTVNLEIYRMVLTTQTLRVPDSDEYYEVPCWVVLFDGLFEFTRKDREWNRSERGLTHDALIINAVDGTVVIPENSRPMKVPGK